MENFEDTELVAPEHDLLVTAITKLDKTQHITEPSRNEPTILSSEFNLIKRSNKLNLSSVAKILEDTAHHVKIGKKLKKTSDVSKVLSKPLEKPQAERIKRATGYEETAKKVGRWDPVVARNRTVDYVSFPIKQASSKLHPTGEFLSKFKSKSDLEMELEEIDPHPIENEEEEEQSFPMTYEEMVEHRQHLAKLRAQQSYKAAKAKRQSKIKSKKYHRVLKKEKLKQQLKEFEELQKKDPEEALKKLEAIEKARALERHTLRHKNTGKWAKNKMIRAKYDKDARQEIADQLAVSRSLTQKIQDKENESDEDDNEQVTDLMLAQDPMNPWMMRRSDKSNISSEFDFGYKKFLKDKMINKHKDESDSDSNDDIEHNDGTTNVSVIKSYIDKLSQLEDVSTDPDTCIDKQVSDDLSPTNKTSLNKRKKKSLKDVAPSKNKKTVATSEWVVELLNEPQSKTELEVTDTISSAFENHESSVAQQVEMKLKEIRRNIENLEKASRAEKKKTKNDQNKHVHDPLDYLKMKKHNNRAIIDEQLLETASKLPDETNVSESKSDGLTNLNSVSAPTQESLDSNIDPTRFIQVKPKYLNTAIPEGVNEYDQLDDDEQVVPKVNIEEVFEEDDVVASFRQEKEDEINKDKPEEINLSLPGWGSWGGKGVKPQKRKRNRFILKGAPKMPRRDENKGDIIIKEYKDPKLALHKVKDVPFPFESVKDYEASIRAPLGNTFIPERAHKKLIRPSVITKAGSIIEPMDEEELLVPKNRTFKNEAVIRLLGQKK